MFKNLLAIFVAIIICASIAHGQTLTTTWVSADDAPNPLVGGSTGRVILGISVDKTAGAVDFTNLVVNTGATDPNTVFSSVELWTSGTNFAAASNTGATVTLNASNITFAGNPTNLFSYGAGVVTGRKFYVVATVRTDVTAVPTIALALTEANTTYSGTPTETAFIITGSTYNFEALVADFTQNAADATALGDEDDVTLLDFTVNSNGTQSLNSTLTFTFNTDVTNILENFDLQVGGVNVAGAETYPLTGGGTILTVTGFTSVDVTSATVFTLQADIKPGVLSANDFIISLASSGVTITPGVPEAFTTFTNNVDVTALEADFTQNAADATAIGDENDVTLLDFTVNSNGTQSLNSTLTFTFNTDVTNILENFDLQVGGVNVAGAETYPLTGGGTILTVTGFTSVNVTNATVFTLQADIKAGATSGNDFTISLVPAGVTITPGNKEAFGTFSNALDVTALEADFSQNTDDATAFSDENGVELLDFTVNSNGTQTISPNLVFTFNVDVTNILENWDLLVGGSDIPGSEVYTLNGAGTQLTISAFTGVDVTNATNFQLLADIKAGATVANDFTISLVPSGVTIAPGTVEAFGTFSNSIDIVTSQSSDIEFTGSSGIALNYRTRQAASIHNTDLNQSFRLGTFQLRDGGGSSDGDNRPSSITSITMQITNPANIRQIALFNETNGESNDDQEIAGTEQSMPGTGTVVFTPTTPIRTLTDGGDWNFMVRVTFNSTVTDNQAMVITITSVTGETNYSGFAAGNAGGATSSGGTYHTILVTATKFRFNPAVATTSPLSTNFGPVTIMAVDGNPPLSNRDLDYNGKIDLTLTSGPGTLTGGGQKTLAAGQVIVPTLSINSAGNHELTVSDDEYNDAPDNQPSIEDVTATINITSAASSITQGTTTPATICYGNTVAGAIPTAYFPLSNIVITEADPAGISGSAGSYTFSITLPTGFVFDQTVTSGVSTSGGADITIPAAPHYSYPSSNTAQFSYNLTATANVNTITISGLKVGYTHPGTETPAPTGTLNITRAGGTATIAGVSVGAVLGTVSASQQVTAVTFTVDELPGDVTVDPSTTNFNVNSNPVKLVPSNSPTAVFTGSGITFVNPDYRFNPGALSPGTYPINYTYTDGSGCQSVNITDFTVFTSGINGLDPDYCNNDPVATGLTVSQVFIDQRMAYYGFPANTWKLDYFVYYDPFGGGFIPITSPRNDQFDPKLPAYQTVVNYFGGQIPIGFAVCNPTNGYPCTCAQPYNPLTCAPVSGNNYGVYDTYQWVTINAAPSPTFTIPKTTFCLDDPAVTLTGTPPNSDVIVNDFFDDGTDNTVSVTPSNPRVWSFTPSALGGPGTVNITYTYENPSTGCSGTSPPTLITVNTRPGSVIAGAITSLGGVSPETCAGQPIGTFTATPLTSPNQYTWYADALLTQVVGVGNSFAPPNPPVDPNVSTGGSPHDFFVTQTINGCESNKQLVSPPPALPLTVTIKAAPAAPTPNFLDVDREFCVGEPITASTLSVPGTAVQWYYPAGTSTVTYNGSNPTAADIDITEPTTGANVYTYEVSQTVSLCESQRTTVKVTIKSLPILSITAGSADLSKVCTTGGLITFTGNDENGPVTTGSWSTVGPAFEPGSLVPLGGTALLTTTALIPDNYTVQFQHTNSAGCTNTTTRPVRVLPRVIASLDPLDSCDQIFVRLNNISVVETAPNITEPASAANIASTQWDFSDGLGLPAGTGSVPIGTNSGRTQGTFLSPEHRFATLGSKSIDYTMITTDGCIYTATEELTINPKPVISFGWRYACIDPSTNESTTEFLAVETTTPTPIPIAQYIWDFKVNNTLNYSAAGTGANPAVNYTAPGTDIAQLIAISPSQCRDTIRKQVFILPTYTQITDSTGYSQSFNSGSDGWIAGGFTSSWQLGSTLGGSTPSDGNAWATGLVGPNNDGENSWVLSGCFNFSDAVKPVISMDIWSDTPDGVDGAVLQYNIDGRIESDNSWEVLGLVGTGIEWYDGSGISNSPGNQSSQDLGWTGTYAGWKQAINKLDDVKPPSSTHPDSLVIFRIAFAGGNRQQSGFAFDNIFIGERSRAVLLENFTNNSVSPTVHNSFYRTFGDVASGELVKIQYHTAFPGDDPLNDLNSQMNNARAAFYGITESPTARLDGDYGNGNITSWLNVLNDDRVLTPSTLRLGATAVKDGAIVRIQPSIENTASQSVQLSDTHLFVTIVEKSVTDPDLLFGSGNSEFVYVAKQMLPSPAGIKLTSDLPGGQFYSGLPELQWEGINGGDAIVIFVQSVGGNNKNVMQAFLLDNPPTPDAITSTEEPQYADKIHLFPNPANQEVNIELPAAVGKETPVMVMDAHGRTVINNTFRIGEIRKSISTVELNGGVYIIQLYDPAGGLIRKKVMVVHH